MDGSIRELRSAVRQLARGKHRNAVRYPASVRTAIIALARTRLGQGHSLARVARGVGVSFPTLASWLAKSGPLALRPVTVAAAAEPAPPLRSPIVLVTPQGFRVEGLDGDALVTVLRALP
jgi:hypothetical protein